MGMRTGWVYLAPSLPFYDRSVLRCASVCVRPNLQPSHSNVDDAFSLLTSQHSMDSNTSSKNVDLLSEDSSSTSIDPDLLSEHAELLQIVQEHMQDDFERINSSLRY